jgi:UPF0755 protein
MKILGSFAAILVIAAAGVAIMAQQFMNHSPSDSGESVRFEVAPGESFKTVAKKLEEQGLITSARKFALYARFSSTGAKVRVGEYALTRNMKPIEVLTIIGSGKSIQYSITVPEGYNLFEIARLIEQQGLAKKEEIISLARDPAFVREMIGEDGPSLEGYLFPETYHLTKFTGPKGFLRMMVERFRENYARLSSDRSWNAAHMTRSQLVTLASIIEKETGAPEERPVISSVFHNRLKLKMKLQTDPTVVYGIWERTGEWNRNISRDDLLTPSRYNTYTIEGLPLGPIANPGFEALKAAGAPAATEYLFFVSRNDGTHVFSRDYSQHQNAVTKFQVDRKAREGKSWRDLKTRDHVPESVTEATPVKAVKASKVSDPKTRP